LINTIEHNEIIASTMHLGEANFASRIAQRCAQEYLVNRKGSAHQVADV
jgi:hypothetical protein